MATVNGYRGMGFANCGRIAEGMSADLRSSIMTGLPAALGNPRPHWSTALVRPSGSTMIAGRFVKYKGELTTIDLEKVKAETAKRAAYITQFSPTERP